MTFLKEWWAVIVLATFATVAVFFLGAFLTKQPEYEMYNKGTILCFTSPKSMCYKILNLK